MPKKHADDLFDLPVADLREVGQVIQTVAQMVKTGTGADGINIGMNNGSAAGQLVWHVHLHIIPRFEGDGFKHWPGQEDLSVGDFETIQAKILAK